MRTKAPVPIDLIAGKGHARLVELYFEAVHLKQLYRQGWLRVGVPEGRCESVAEHSFGVALLALLIADAHFPELDAAKVIRIALLHDLAEVHAGGITAHHGVSKDEKERLERASMQRIFAGVPGGDRYVDLWEEYEAQASPEAVLVRQLDRLEMALQACVYEHQLGLDLGEFFASAGKVIDLEALKAIFSAVQAARPVTPR